MFVKAIGRHPFWLVAILTGLLGFPALADVADELRSPTTQAQKLLDKGDLRGAEIQLRNAVRANPGDAAAHIQLAEIYLKIGNFSAAEAEAREAQQANGDDELVTPVLAQALLQENKLEQLLRQIQPADRPHKVEATIRLTLGLAHLALLELNLAEPLLSDAQRLDPGNWQPKFALARLAFAKGDLAEGNRQLAAAASIAPDEVEISRMQGEAKRTSGDIDGALAIFSKILARQPDDVATLTSRASAYVIAGKMAEAQSDIDHALKVSPSSGYTLYVQALLDAEIGQLGKADDILSKLATKFPSLPSGYYLQGSVKYALGQYEQAETSLKKYLSLYPNEPGVRRILAAISLSKNDYRRAIELLKPVEDADPTNNFTIDLLSRAYVAAGRKDDAIELYERMAKSDPGAMTEATAALARIRLGNPAGGVAELEKIAGTEKGSNLATPIIVMTELQQGDIAKAGRMAEALVEREPDNSVALNLLGTVRAAQDRLPEAQDIFEKLVKSDPRFLSARRNLANVYIALNRPDEASKVLAETLRLEPEDEQTHLALAQLAISQRDMTEAATQLQQAQNAAPKDVFPGLKLLNLYADQKNWTTAIKLGRQLEAQFRFDPRVVDGAADVRARSGDAKGAAAEFGSLVLHYPTAAPLHARYAVYQERAGDTDGARVSLQTAISLAPTDRRYMTALTRYDYEHKGVDIALATAKGFATTDPEQSTLLAVEVLSRANRMNEAIETLSHAQQKNPTSGIAITLAILTDRTGKHDEALDLLKAWLKGHGNDLDAHVELANLLLASRDFDAAQAAYEQIRGEAPLNVVVLNNLAGIYSRRHDTRAADLARQTYRLAPSPSTEDTLGWALLATGNADTALPYIREAAATLPTNATFQYHLAAALSATGDKVQARSLLEKVLTTGAVFEDREDAQRLFEQLQRG